MRIRVGKLYINIYMSIQCLSVFKNLLVLLYAKLQIFSNIQKLCAEMRLGAQ